MALLEMRGVSGEFDEQIYPTGTPRTITTSSGQTYNYDDVVNLILARYAEGKNPALAVKSALQLGFPEDVIRTLPGVDAQAFEEGKRLIESGAFVEQATGTKADIQQAAPVGSAQYNARIAAGLDAFGFPPEEVARLTAQGLYGAGKQFDPGTQGLLTITALGDSTTWGYNSGQKVEKNMVTTAQEELSKKLGQPVDIINRGQNATTIGDAIANGNLYAAASDPSNVVVLNFGMNEAYRRVDPAEFRQNILDAAGYLQSLGKTVVLQTPNFTANPDIPNVETYANVVRDVAGQYGLTLDDKYAATQNAEFSQNDLTHPTAQVYQDLGKSLANALAPVVAPQEKRTAGSVTEPQARAGEGGPTTGLLGQAPIVPQDVKSQLDAFGPYDPNSEVWYYGGPQIVSEGKIYRKDPSGNIDITIAGGGPGSLQQVVSPTGELLLSTTDTGETSRLMAFAQNALPAAAAAALLGPAGAGLLSTPAAAAAGAGGTTLAKGGSVEDALKAAVLSGVAAYGLDYLLASPELLAARELASSGLSEEAIVDTLISRGVSTNAAIEAASNATGLPAAGSARGLGDFTSTGATSVPVTGTAGAGVGAIAPAAAALPVVSAFTPGLLNQQVQVQSQTGGTQQAATTAIPAAGAGLLAQTQTVPVTSQTGATTQQTAAPVANLLTATAPTQTVPVSSQTVATTQQAAGPAGAMLGAAIAPTQTVPIETRTIPTQERAVTIPVVPSESVTVQGKREPVPTATALIPAGAAGAAAGVTKPATPTSNITATDAALAALLLGGAGSLLNQSQSGGFTMDPNLANAIINAPRPNYRGGVGGYQMPGMFQIAPTDVYNPFATTAPFGTGRFGGFAAPITLPYGLLATETNPVGMRLTTPTRGLA